MEGTHNSLLKEIIDWVANESEEKALLQSNTYRSCKDSYTYYAVRLCNESSFLTRHVIGTLFVQSFSYSYFCILSYTHYHSCTFQYTKGFEELCNQKISTQDEREEGHNLTGAIAYLESANRR